MLRKILLLIPAIIAVALFAKLGWDEYQQNRAANQVPHVEAIFHEIRQLPGAEATGETSISINEYATALWQRYKVNNKCAELRPHFDFEASRQGFQFHGEFDAYSGTEVEYRNGEFEIRLLCLSGGYSFSVNWYGQDR